MPLCGTWNVMDRLCCRRCENLAPRGQDLRVPPPSGQLAPGAGGAQAGLRRLPPGSVWANPQRKEAQPPRTLAAKATALEQALAAARSAGASKETLVALEDEVAGARQQAADTRPLGARLDSARAKLDRATTKVADTEEGLRQAMERQQLALTQHEEAQAELNGLLAAQVLGDGESGIVRIARTLLQALEHSAMVVAGSNAPAETVLEAMRSLQQAIGEPREEEVPAMDLEPDAAIGDEAAAQRHAIPSGARRLAAPEAPAPTQALAETNRAAPQQPPEGFLVELRRLEDASHDDAAFGVAVRQAMARPAPY